jgi:hypothetical protein
MKLFLQTVVIAIIIASAGVLIKAQTSQNLPVTLSVNVPRRTYVNMIGNVVNPGDVDLVKTVVAPTLFTINTFPKDGYVVLYIFNDSGFAMTWATAQKMTLLGGHMPTNQTRAAIVFVEVNGEIFCAPSTP